MDFFIEMLLSGEGNYNEKPQPSSPQEGKTKNKPKKLKKIQDQFFMV